MTIYHKNYWCLYAAMAALQIGAVMPDSQRNYVAFVKPTHLRPQPPRGLQQQPQQQQQQQQEQQENLPPSSELWCSFVNLCVVSDSESNANTDTADENANAGDNDTSPPSTNTTGTTGETAVVATPEQPSSSTTDMLCNLLQLCDLTPAPAPAPGPSSTSGTPAAATSSLASMAPTASPGSEAAVPSLLDLCVYIGLCVLHNEPTNEYVNDPAAITETTTEPGATSAPSWAPTFRPSLRPAPLPTTTAPTYKPPPEFDSVCDFLGNCEPTKVPENSDNNSDNNTLEPSLAPTPSPTIKTSSPAPTKQTSTSSSMPPAAGEATLESDQAVGFLCSVLGWCDLDVSVETIPPTTNTNTNAKDPVAVVSTQSPTAAPTKYPTTATATTTTAPSQESTPQSLICRFTTIC